MRNTRSDLARLTARKEAELERLYSELVATAFDARKEAVNYREFFVGAAALCWKKNGKLTNSFKVVRGANFMPKPKGMGPRVCAEAMVMERAKTLGCTEIIGFVVAAPHQADDRCGTDLGVTLPCGYCRDQFTADIRKGGLIRPRTRLICINVGRPESVVRLTVADLLAIEDAHSH